MTARRMSTRVDTHLADEARKLVGVCSRTEAVHTALREVVASRRFKALMRNDAGKLSFAATDQASGTLPELLKRISHDNLHGEADFGNPAGKEVW